MLRLAAGLMRTLSWALNGVGACGCSWLFLDQDHVHMACLDCNIILHAACVATGTHATTQSLPP